MSEFNRSIIRKMEESDKLKKRIPRCVCGEFGWNFEVEPDVKDPTPPAPKISGEVFSPENPSSEPNLGWRKYRVSACTTCGAAPGAELGSRVLLFYAQCDHNFARYDEFGSVPVEECGTCGLVVLDPEGEYAED